MSFAAKKRQKNPTNDSLNYKSKQRHRDEPLRAAVAIHGTRNDLIPALDDLLDTISGEFEAPEVVEKIFNSQKTVSNAILKKYETSFCSD